MKIYEISFKLEVPDYRELESLRADVLECLSVCLESRELATVELKEVGHNAE